jgi:hypothetical protein
MLMRSRFVPACVLSSLFIAACDSTEPPGPPASISAMSATTVTATVGASVADSLGVKIVDANGRAVPNVQVSWSVEGVPALVTVSPGTSVTDRSGVAKAAVQPGTVTGNAIVRANVPGAGAIPFAITLNAGAPTQFQAATTLTLGTAVSRPWITAKDQFGNVASLTGVTLQSSNPAVATISASGTITSVALGATTITAQAGTATAQARVWVVPATIRACETNTARLCSNWTLADSIYNARWDQGSEAVIRVGHFSADSVRFVRDDPAGTSSGLRAVYQGRVNQRTAAGVVTWTTGGISFSGTWDGTW